MKFSTPLAFIFLMAFGRSVFAQYGCTDTQASNYNPSATINDGSCIYSATNLSLTSKANLSTPLLDESSGIEFYNNKLWTHNDSNNPNTIFRIDSTSSTVLQTVTVSNATNSDWEDITSSDDYLFIGDIGNNNGNRTNLRIYKISKSDLTDTATTVTAQIINFSYSDQTVFTSLPNNNNYDCEAMIFYNDSLHLFSKDWVDKQSRHYVLPANAGTYVAQVRETFNAGCLITGAGIQDGGVIALCGYDNTGFAPIYMWMLYDYHGSLFFNGNKRRFDLSSAIANGQVEGIDFKNNAYGYISNERFIQSIFNVSPKLKSFDLASYLPVSFVIPKPVADFTVSTISICKNKDVAFTDLSTKTPTTWQWNFPGGTPASSTLQNPVVKYSIAGTYSVTLIAGNAGGSDTLTLNNFITVNTTPNATITATGSTFFCTGGSVVLNANTAAGLTYQWKKNNGNISGAISSTYTATVTGDYKVLVTNANGCTRIANTISITGPPVSKITAGGPLSFCNGDSVILNAASGAGYTYQWLKNNIAVSGATSSTYTAKVTGNYKVRVTNSFACTVTSAPKTVTVNCKTHSGTGAEQWVKVQPNPSNTSFNIQLTNNTAVLTTIFLTDITGRLLEKVVLQPAINSVKLGNDLTPGIYFITAVQHDKKEIIRLEKM
ncbi:MAG: PKD domain-containing protein [Bacteroidia bacterium]